MAVVVGYWASAARDTEETEPITATQKPLGIHWSLKSSLVHTDITAVCRIPIRQLTRARVLSGPGDRVRSLLCKAPGAVQIYSCIYVVNGGAVC